MKILAQHRVEGEGDGEGRMGGGGKHLDNDRIGNISYFTDRVSLSLLDFEKIYCHNKGKRRRRGRAGWRIQDVDGVGWGYCVLKLQVNNNRSRGGIGNIRGEKVSEDIHRVPLLSCSKVENEPSDLLLLIFSVGYK